MIYAGFWKRFAALIIDGCILAVVYLLLMIFPFFPMLFWVLISGYYHVVFETSPLRATPGKALMKMAVLKTNGTSLTVKDSIARFALSFLSSMLLCMGYFISLFTEKKQTLHDIVADTIVVEEVFSTYNFWKIFVDRSKEIFTKPATTHQSLEELYNLHQKGILSDEEYRIKKEEYLKRL